MKDSSLNTLFSVSPTQMVSNVPTSFTSSGDVAFGYDLNFTNQTSSYIKSLAPLYLEAGESAESNPLTLRTYNNGSVVMDSAFTNILGQLNVSSYATFGSTLTLNNLTYSFPSSQTNGYVLQTNGTGSLSWVNASSLTVTDPNWNRATGVLSPKNITDALILGSNATSSALVHLTGTSGQNSWINTGNVGIGTTNPSAKLTVTLPSGVSVINTVAKFMQPGSGSGIGAAIEIGPTDFTTKISGFYQTGGNVLSFGVGDGASVMSEKMRINYSGQVGIGTTTPTALLDVAGSASLSGTLAFRGTTDPKIDILNGENFGIRTSVGGDAALSEKLTILNNGNVGIGTTNPANTLQVVGNAYIQNGSLSVGYGTVSSNYTIKLPNNNAIGWRNASNNGDIQGIKVDAGDNVIRQ
jgi:hypothetical protein